MTKRPISSTESDNVEPLPKKNCTRTPIKIVEPEIGTYVRITLEETTNSCSKMLKNENGRKLFTHKKDRSFKISKSPWLRVTCDGCNKTDWSGIRYKCLICENFDFCKKCEENDEKRTAHFEGEHVFIKMR